LKTDRIDYYLLHNINTLDSWERMKQLGVKAFIEQKKRDGIIKHIGFSFHGNLRDFKIVIDDYPWEFIQIQLNYLDEYFQAGLEGMRYAAKKGIGVIIMEPLRGGMLVDKMPPTAKKMMAEYKDGQGAVRSPAEWGLRWVWNHPEVTLALSGMNDDAHVKENVRVAADAEADALSGADLEMIASVKNIFETTLKVNCTGCAYCMPCPAGVNIPQCFAQYNSRAMFGGVVPTVSYLLYTAPGRNTPSARASACKKCGKCEKKCPQQIPIMRMLDDVKQDMEKQPMKFFVSIGAKIMGR
jgi:predicted aldo/keto reductase-like oxidoreductase